MLTWGRGLQGGDAEVRVARAERFGRRLLVVRREPDRAAALGEGAAVIDGDRVKWVAVDGHGD